MILIDLQKVFEPIDHDILLQKCKYKEFDACVVLSCHQQGCYIFVNVDEFNLLKSFCYCLHFKI